MAGRLAEAFGVPASELSRRLDNHLLRVDLTCPARMSADGVASFDWWGAGFDTREEGYFVCVSPLQENPDLDAFPWPDPHAPSLLNDARRLISDDGGEHFIVPNFGWALFERAWSLRGMVEFFTWIAARPRNDRMVRVSSLDMEGESFFSRDAIGHDGALRWANYVRCMARAMQDAGCTLAGVEALIHSTVPVSAGLSSSAALEMAAAGAGRG